MILKEIRHKIPMVMKKKDNKSQQTIMMHLGNLIESDSMHNKFRVFQSSYQI